MDIDALWNLVGHWSVLAEADDDSPNDELSDNVAIAYGQSLAFGVAARELSEFLALAATAAPVCDACCDNICSCSCHGSANPTS